MCSAAIMYPFSHSIKKANVPCKIVFTSESLSLSWAGTLFVLTTLTVCRHCCWDNKSWKNKLPAQLSSHRLAIVSILHHSTYTCNVTCIMLPPPPTAERPSLNYYCTASCVICRHQDRNRFIVYADDLLLLLSCFILFFQPQIFRLANFHLNCMQMLSHQIPPTDSTEKLSLPNPDTLRW